MPTHEELSRFIREFRQLSLEQQREFLRAVLLLRRWLASGAPEPPRTLRLKRARGHARVWEISWAPDGRATFEYGPEVIPGHAHIIWRRVGTHDIFTGP